MSDLFIIRDSDDRAMQIAGITIFGVKTAIPAIFFAEQDALDILFAIEEAGLTTIPHTVSRIEDSFMAAEDD